MRTLKHLLVIFAAAVLLAFTPSTIAEEMQEYIDKTCSSGCVDAQELLKAVHSAADSYDVDPVAILAIVSVESSFRTRATNGTSVGLTQVLRRLHRDKFKGSNPYAVQDNIFAGVQVLSNCLKKHKGSYHQAYRCYNGYGQAGTAYSSKVQRVYKKLKEVNTRLLEYDPIGTLIETPNQT